MVASIVRGKYVICWAGSDVASSTMITDGAVFQRDWVIKEDGPYQSLRASHYPDQDVGGPNFLVFPDLINRNTTAEV